MRTSFSATQLKLLRERLRAYHAAECAKWGQSYSWRNVSEAIFAYTDVEFRGDSLRQFAEGQISRGNRRGIGEQRIQAIVAFLTHPHIKALLPEELEEPMIPYQIINHLIEYLREGEHTPVSMPPRALEGAYRVLSRSEEELLDINLELTLSNDRRFVHFEEAVDVYRAGDEDPANFSPAKRKHDFRKHYEGRGWGVLTPEETIIAFMKRAPSMFGVNYYYATLGTAPEMFADSEIQILALFAYDYPHPVGVDQAEWTEKLPAKVLDCVRMFRRQSASSNASPAAPK